MRPVVLKVRTCDEKLRIRIPQKENYRPRVKRNVESFRGSGEFQRWSYDYLLYRYEDGTDANSLIHVVIDSDDSFDFISDYMCLEKIH